MNNRKILQNRVRRIAAINTNVDRPRLTATNAVLEQWIQNNSITPENLQQATPKLLFSRQLRQRIEAKQFQEIFSEVVNGITLSKQQAIQLYNAMVADGRYVITYNYSTSPINPLNRSFILQLLQNGFIPFDEDRDIGSDKQRENLVGGVYNVLIRLLPPLALNRNADGAFFPRLNKNHSIMDLSRYQIFGKSQSAENCLIHTLIISGKISPDIINAVKLAITIGTSIAKKSLNKIADIIEHTLIITEYDSLSKQFRPWKYGKHEASINIALYDNHYFLLEDTKYSSYAVKNCEALQDHDSWFDIFTAANKRSKTRKINSIKLVQLMDSCGYFYKGDMTQAPEAADHIQLRDHIFLGNIENEQRLVPTRLLKQNTSAIYYADCESFVSEGNHQLFLLGFVGHTNEVSIINFANLDERDRQVNIYQFLSAMTKNGKVNATVYFHNLNYDYSLLEPYLNISSVCKKDRQLYSVKCFYKSCSIEFRDSYKLAPMPLSGFCKNFNLDPAMNKLEAINYTYYTNQNATDIEVSTELYAKGLKTKELPTFWKNVNNAKTFNALEYYKEYLRMDCLVLKHGLTKFNEIIKGLDDRLSIYNSLTISSLTDLYMNINGAYEGVFEQTGNLREYISNAIYGGRVNVNPVYVKQVIEEKIADYDGVSLYPSSIHRLCREFGLPTGACVAMDINTIKHFEDLDIQDYAIMSIQITKVNKHQPMPFIAEKNTDSLNYINHAPNKIIHIDNYTLGDYIKFHDIEYTIIQGVIWKSGNKKNDTMGNLIMKLFNKRIENKSTNPALANILKLMLNSSYGKTIMKKTSTQCRIVKRDTNKLDPETKEWTNTPDANFNAFLNKNFNTIKAIRIINKKLYEVDQLAVDTSYNRGQVGCAILSISKRIMNEVFDTAALINAPIYYTDTDSIHMRHGDVPRLEDKFREVYNRELNGTGLGQFHSYFDLDKAATEVYAIRSIFLGKKSYIDHLERTNVKGEKIQGYHIRLKGITKESIIHHSKEYASPFAMFEYLATGETKKMTLNPYNPEENSHKVLFEFIPAGGVRTRSEFVREIRF